MGKILKCFFYFLVILLILSGCQTSSTKEDIFQYKDSYVGDNGAVGNITAQLPSPNGEQLKDLELKTTEEPFGIILKYENGKTTEENVKNYKETALYNATFLFALVKNADWVTFQFMERDIKVTREQLENWYGTNLRDFKSEDELTTFTQPYVEDENKVNAFLN